MLTITLRSENTFTTLQKEPTCGIEQLRRECAHLFTSSATLHEPVLEFNSRILMDHKMLEDYDCGEPTLIRVNFVPKFILDLPEINADPLDMDEAKITKICKIVTMWQESHKNLEISKIVERPDVIGITFHSTHPYYKSPIEVLLQWKSRYWNLQVTTPILHPQVLLDGRVWFYFISISNQVKQQPNPTNIIDFLQKLFNEPKLDCPTEHHTFWETILPKLEKISKDVETMFGKNKWSPEINYLMPQILKNEILVLLWVGGRYDVYEDIIFRIIDVLFQINFRKESCWGWLKRCLTENFF